MDPTFNTLDFSSLLTFIVFTVQHIQLICSHLISIHFSRGQNDDASSSSQLRRQSSTDEVLNPGQVGFVSRARVPKPSTRAYVHRPKPVIEGQFHGPSKARSTTRFDIAQRAFKERTKTQKARRHAGPSIAGNKMEI